MKNLNLKKGEKIRITANRLERMGYLSSRCMNRLKEVFDIAADSVYSANKDAGIYVKVELETISKEALEIILKFPTARKKELWIFKTGENKNDPGSFQVYRFEGNRLIEEPPDWPISKVLSTPLESGVKSPKTVS